MKSHDLAKKLLAGPNLEIAILDGFNGGGNPRVINLGPSVRDVRKEHQKLDTDDIESSSGNIIVIGYGCY